MKINLIKNLDQNNFRSDLFVNLFNQNYLHLNYYY